MVEETKRKIASGELVLEPDEPEVEPCDCVGCTPHLGPAIPCTGKRPRWHRREVKAGP